MRMLKWLAGLVLAGVMSCAQALAADVKISAMPAATLPDDMIKLSGVQGTGCATSVTPCSNVSVTTGDLSGYVGGKIGTSYGRSILSGADASSVRTLLGLGALSTSSTAPVVNGGTGATDAATARSNLSAQASSSVLTGFAGLSPAANDVLQYKSGAWVNRTPVQLRQDLGVGTAQCLSGVASTLTGSTSETALATCVIPAGAIGPNGQVEIITQWSVTNDANAKTLKVRFGSMSGVGFYNSAFTTTASIQAFTRFANRNSQASQVGEAPALAAGFGQSSGVTVTGTVDTSIAQTLYITGQLATSTDTITLESYIVRVIYGS